MVDSWEARAMNHKPSTMLLSLIAAVARNNVIGSEGRLPWRLPDDLAHFKAITLGKPLIMGRRTFESIGRPLPGRQTIVLTRQAHWTASGCTVASTAETALQAAGSAPEVMVMGGAEIYRLFLPQAHRFYLTEVGAEVEGDTRFPDWNRNEWQERSREFHPADARHAVPFSIVVLERRTDVKS